LVLRSFEPTIELAGSEFDAPGCPRFVHEVARILRHPSD